MDTSLGILTFSWLLLSRASCVQPPGAFRVDDWPTTIGEHVSADFSFQVTFTSGDQLSAKVMQASFSTMHMDKPSSGCDASRCLHSRRLSRIPSGSPQGGTSKSDFCRSPGDRPESLIAILSTDASCEPTALPLFELILNSIQL